MNLPSFLSAGSLELLTADVLEIAIKSTLLLGAALVAHAALSRRRTLACSAMWNACLVALILLPLAVLALPAIDVPTPWLVSQAREVALPRTATTGSSQPNAAPAGWSNGDNGDGEYLEQNERAPAAVAPTALTTNGESMPFAYSGNAHAADDVPAEPGGNWRRWLVAAYSTGFVLLAFRLLLNLLAVRRLRNGAVAIDDNAWHARLAHWSAALAMRRRVALLASGAVTVPIVVGTVRPAIILPPQLVGQLSPQRRDAVLIHELAHVRRGDYAWQLLLAAVQVVYWPQPLVWLAARCIARLRERACDDVCIHALGGRDEYRATLVDLARALVRPRALSLGMAAVRSTKIASRLAAIDRSSGNRYCLARPRTRWSLAVFLAAIAMVVGAMHPAATMSAAEAQQTQAAAANAAAANTTATERQGEAPGQAAKSENLTVTVLDENGKPSPGLTVEAFRSWGTGPFKPEKTFTTDKQGRLLLPRELTVDENEIQLVARSKDNRLSFLNFHPRYLIGDQAIKSETFELRLSPLERTIRGKLVDQDGKPITSAAVGVRSLGYREPRNRSIDWYGAPEESPLGHAMSQDDGTFAVQVPRVSYGAVTVSHKNFVAVYRYFPLDNDDVGTIGLRPGAVIEGRAVHAVTGKPVAGARIFASDQLDDRDEPRTGEINYGSAYTGADGRYEIGNLKPGVYHIGLYGVESQPQLTAMAHQRLPIEGGSTTTADFRVIDGRLLAGKVVDIDEGAPIKEVEVAVNSPAYPRSSRGGHHHAKTDSEGKFHFYLPPGEAHVQINDGEIGGLPESKRSVFLEADSPLEPIVLRGRSREKVQERNKLRVSGGYGTYTKAAANTAPKPKELTIRFRTSDGKPVGPSATEIWSRGDGPGMWMAHSGNEFSFPESYVAGFGPAEVPNTGGGRTSYLVIDAEGYARPEPVAVRAGQEQSTITVDLKTPTYVPIRGRVIDGQGAPIAGANVATWLYTLGQRGREPWGAQYVTDKQGRFETKHVYVGSRISLHITKAGWSGALIEPRLLADADPIDLGDLVMTEPNGVIEGRVVDLNDEPLPGLVVAEQTYKIQTRTNAQGRFRLTNLPVGEASVAVVGDEYESFPRKVPVGTSDMLIKLYPKSPERRTDVPMIRAKFQTADGKPVTAKSTLWWIDIAAEPTLWVTASPEGDGFEFSNVWQHALAKDKPQRLVIEVAGYKRPEPLEVATNKELTPVITLEPAARVPVSGRVLDADGKPVEGATAWTTLKIWGELESGTWGPSATTDKEGRFTLDHIKDGDDVTMYIGKPGFAGAMQRRAAKAGSPIELGEIRLSAARAQLTGAVVNREKKPVAGARVYSNYLGKTFETTTDAAGRFTLAGLPDGKVMLTVEADTFRAQYPTDSNSKDVTLQEYPRY